MSQKNKIVVVDYQPIWAQQFEEIKALFQQRLGVSFLSIEHVGSTSVVGLAAKPILDIDIVVKNDVMVGDVIEKLSSLGYVHVGDQGVSGREVVKLRNEEAPLYHLVRSWPKHHLYICKQGVASLQNHLHLRDYLRKHPDKVAEYGALKKQLAIQFPEDIDAYIDGKTPLISSILKASGFIDEDLKDIELANRLPADACTIRFLAAEDLPFLKEMFFTSLFVPEGEAPFPASIIERPDLAKYYQNWGQASDLGLVMENENGPIGAAWSRFFTSENPGYGFVREDSPEIGIALHPAQRGKGLGTRLLTKLLQELAWRSIPSVSLSVDGRNQAIRLYERLGFERYQEDGDAVTMLKRLTYNR